MADDAIGYGRPPKRTQFVKGQSGNPSGRPEGSQNLAAVLNATIRQRIKVTENGRIRYTTKFEAIIAQLVNKALRGDVNAIHELRYWIQFLEDSLQTNSQPLVTRENDEAVVESFGTTAPNRKLSSTRFCKYRFERGAQMSATQQLTYAEYQALLRLDLITFIERSFYELNPQATFARSLHIEVLATKLAASRRGQLRRLIVCIPPRMLKSIAVSVAFPAWLLGHDPTKQIICASYGQDLAEKHARDCRTLIMSDFYRVLFPRTRLSPEKQSVNDFLTTAQGFRMSTSVGGVLTVVLVPPETGVVKIVAVSSDVSTNSSGDLLRDKFNALRSSLEANYGKAALVFDFLVLRSNWNEPSEWMMALLNHERIFMATWEPDQEGVGLAEKACAISTGTGYIMVTYEFPNFSLWKQSVATRTMTSSCQYRRKC